MKDLIRKIQKYLKIDKNKLMLFINIGFIFMILTFMIIGIYNVESQTEPTKEYTYNEFLNLVNDKKINTVTINFNSSDFNFTDTDNNIGKTYNPRIDNFKEFLLKNDIKVIEEKSSSFTIISVFSNLIYFVFLFIMIKRFNPVAKAKNFKTTNVPDITFSNIAGNKELKKDLGFIVEFLKEPEKIKNIGARMPKGIILYGPPGTGKTLTAKAIAGTAGVPFYKASGSDFMEMYVGVGAKRVRELFNEAKKNAPCIVFIDEIDAIGSRSVHSENNEKDQTINALLTELDGFDSNSGIITICATNRKDSLDNALTRTGRFDKQLYVGLPNKADRKEIIDVYMRNKKVSNDVDFNELASITVGFSGSDIETLINEAALISVSKNIDYINKESIETSFYRLIMKGDKKEDQQKRNLKELELVAWHEAGHTLATKLLTNEEITKVTILSSTSGAGGVTFRVPEENGLQTKEYIENTIKILYAGRIAEQILYNDDDSKITTGASNDIKEATNLIKSYINVFGMNQFFGMINVDEFNKGSSFVVNNSDTSLKQAINISEKLYKETYSLLSENKELLHNIAVNLLQKESLDSSEINLLMKGIRNNDI